MDPKKLPVTVLLALGLAGCGEKEVDSAGPCLSIAPDDTADDSGADDSAGPCLSPVDDTQSDVAAADAERSPEPIAPPEQRAVLNDLLQRGALPADVAAKLSEPICETD